MLQETCNEYILTIHIPICVRELSVKRLLHRLFGMQLPLCAVLPDLSALPTDPAISTVPTLPAAPTVSAMPGSRIPQCGLYARFRIILRSNAADSRYCRLHSQRVQ